MNIDQWYLENLVCPRERSGLTREGDFLRCQSCRQSYPVVEGVPVMLLEDQAQTMEIVENSIKRARQELIDSRAADLYLESLGISEEEKLLAVSLIGKTKIDPVVNVIVSATSGRLYKSLIGKLEDYPIPKLRLEKGEGKKLLDIGCNWGRWSIAASKLGFQVVGIDPSLGAIMSARRVSHSLGLNVKYLVADARFLPLRNEYFDVIFSYSVLQHLSKPNVWLCLAEIARLLRAGGYSFIQMANKYGIGSLYHQLRRGFREPVYFEVRYWKPKELIAAFKEKIGQTKLEVDNFFGLGVQKSDIRLMPWHYQIIISIADLLRSASERLSLLINVADSVYIKSIKMR